MLRFSKMHPDLIASSGLELHRHMRCIRQSFHDLVMRYCQLAIIFVICGLARQVFSGREEAPKFTAVLRDNSGN